MVEVKILPLDVMVVVSVLHDDLHPSQNMNHMSFLEVDHMHDSLCLHAPLIDKMNNISWMDLTLYSACRYILHVGFHRIDICDTMVCFRNLVGSSPQIEGDSKSQGKCL